MGKILLLMHKFIQQILILVSAQAKILLVALEVCGGWKQKKEKEVMVPARNTV